MGCYVWYSERGTGLGRSPPRPLFAVPNVTVHPSTASVPITVPLVYCFNVSIKGLTKIIVIQYFFAMHNAVARCLYFCPSCCLSRSCID